MNNYIHLSYRPGEFPLVALWVNIVKRKLPLKWSVSILVKETVAKLPKMAYGLSKSPAGWIHQGCSTTDSAQNRQNTIRNQQHDCLASLHVVQGCFPVILVCHCPQTSSWPSVDSRDKLWVMEISRLRCTFCHVVRISRLQHWSWASRFYYLLTSAVSFKLALLATR